MTPTGGNESWDRHQDTNTHLGRPHWTPPLQDWELLPCTVTFERGEVREDFTEAYHCIPPCTMGLDVPLASIEPLLWYVLTREFQVALSG